MKLPTVPTVYLDTKLNNFIVVAPITMINNKPVESITYWSFQYNEHRWSYYKDIPQMKHLYKNLVKLGKL